MIDPQSREPARFWFRGRPACLLPEDAAGCPGGRRERDQSLRGRCASPICPSYDVDDREGFPPGADEFRRRLELCNALVISSPEYNAATPGVLENTIDWVSPFHPQPFNERHGLLSSASRSMIRRRPRPVAAADPWRILALASIPTCSRSRRPAAHSGRLVGGAAAIASRDHAPAARARARFAAYMA